MLTLKTSLYSEQGESSRLADAFAQAWQAREPASRIIVRDLAADPVPHPTAERFGAFLAKAEERTAEQQGVVDYSDRLIAELKDADAIAIGLPLYNFGVPSMSYIRQTPVVLGAITLDLFATLIGGATALLPIYARDILQMGPSGLGILRSAPAIGALIASVVLVWLPLRRNVGRTMFASVVVFGLMRSERAKWAKVIETANVRIE